MTRPNYVNVYVRPNGEREIWLKVICKRLDLEPSHKSYLVAIDAALAAMVAGLTERKGNNVNIRD